MARGPGIIKQADVKRALCGVAAAGVEVARVEIDTRTGTIVILTPRATASPVDAYDAWKAQSDAR